jgi:hypothetical protein
LKLDEVRAYISGVYQGVPGEFKGNFIIGIAREGIRVEFQFLVGNFADSNTVVQLWRNGKLFFDEKLLLARKPGKNGTNLVTPQVIIFSIFLSAFARAKGMIELPDGFCFPPVGETEWQELLAVLRQ